jgi:hypothetical protein
MSEDHHEDPLLGEADVVRSVFDTQKYSSLQQQQENITSSRVVTKFCNFGIVSSKSWSDTFVTVNGGVVRLYDSSESFMRDSHSHVLEIKLTKNHRASGISKKNYSKDIMKVIDFYCFYVEIDNGIFAPTKLLKIGSLDESVVRKLAVAVMSSCEASGRVHSPVDRLFARLDSRNSNRSRDSSLSSPPDVFSGTL